jgi:transcriptional regulator with XRE-family HTH domain
MIKFYKRRCKKMKTANTSIRLKEIMEKNNIRQIDIVNMCAPYCEKYNVKMNKSDISQYVSGKTEPNQDKLAILGMALNVNEAWLMGFDVPIEREPNKYSDILRKEYGFSRERKLLEKYNMLDDNGKHTVDTILEMEYLRCNKPHLLPNAAHERPGATQEDKVHDDAIMDDDNF